MPTVLPVVAYGPSHSCQNQRPEASENGKVGSTGCWSARMNQPEHRNLCITIMGYRRSQGRFREEDRRLIKYDQELEE